MSAAEVEMAPRKRAAKMVPPFRYSAEAKAAARPPLARMFGQFLAPPFSCAVPSFCLYPY